MFVEQRWRASGEPPREPNGRRSTPLTKRDEKLLLWMIVANLLLMLVAPIGGASVVQAVIALFAAV